MTSDDFERAASAAGYSVERARNNSDAYASMETARLWIEYQMAVAGSNALRADELDAAMAQEACK
ncbi:hypothetical protein N8I74_10865 [Chitiniphilus purpureus]|uniref:Uncharacterized protein n=1 Tax=Chitiniphilus purpureus TaxID=2981137 RepID=A0ABY6DJF0_9NEIS|nr:hypothetical protein [Chitiniphilus sp. CD1]UXY13823.1 hypothetical protein N8I74_10865 [Chitiniphilus sp. CD1]